MSGIVQDRLVLSSKVAESHRIVAAPPVKTTGVNAACVLETGDALLSNYYKEL